MSVSVEQLRRAIAAGEKGYLSRAAVEALKAKLATLERAGVAPAAPAEKAAKTRALVEAHRQREREAIERAARNRPVSAPARRPVARPHTIAPYGFNAEGAAKVRARLASDAAKGKARGVVHVERARKLARGEHVPGVRVLPDMAAVRDHAIRRGEGRDVIAALERIFGWGNGRGVRR